MQRNALAVQISVKLVQNVPDVYEG